MTNSSGVASNVQGLWRLPRPQDYVCPERDLAALQQAWDDGDPFICVMGPSGIGKSCLVREFLESLPSGDGLVWNFDHTPDPEAMLNELHQVLTGEIVTWARVDTVVHLVKQRPQYLLVLDGLDRFLTPSGHLLDALLRHLLDVWPGRCVVTVARRTPALRSSRSVIMPFLAQPEFNRLIAKLGVLGTERSDMVRLYLQTLGNPLALRLCAGVISLCPYRVRFEAMQPSGLLASVMHWYRKFLSPDVQQILRVVCAVGEPIDTLTLKSILRLEALPDEGMLDLRQTGLIDTNGRGSWIVHPLVRSLFLSDLEAADANAAVADALGGRDLARTPSNLSHFESWLYHQCASGQTLTAYRMYERTVRPLVAHGRDPARTERITRLLLEAFEGPLPGYGPRLPFRLDPFRNVIIPWVLPRPSYGQQQLWWLGCMLPMSVFRPQVLAGSIECRATLHLDRTRALTLLGDMSQAARHYRRALRLRSERLEVLIEYVENLIVRGHLKLAETLAGEIRDLTIAKGNPGREMEGWMCLWYIRRLRGRTTLDLPSDPPPGPAMTLKTDILVRQGRTDEALRLAEINHLHAKSKADKARPLVQGLQGSRERDAEERIEKLLAWTRQEGDWYLVCQLLTVAKQHDEALQLARQRGFRLLEIDLRIQMGQRTDSYRTRIDYAWGQYSEAVVFGENADPLRERLFVEPVPLEPAVGYWPCQLTMPEFPSKPLFPGLAAVPWIESYPPFAVLGWEGLNHDLPHNYKSFVHQMVLTKGVLSIEEAYNHAVLLMIGGPSKRVDEAVAGLAPIEPLLLASLQAAAHPGLEHIEKLSTLLRERRHVLPRIRAVAAWHLGIIAEAAGDIEQAREAYHLCLSLDTVPFVAEQLEKLGKRAPAPRCSVNLPPMIESLEKWRRINPRLGFPLSLDSLVPRWWSMVPVCEDGGGPLLYRVNRYKNRFLIGCRKHYRLYDSTLGDLGRAVPRQLPPMTGLGLQSVVEDVMILKGLK